MGDERGPGEDARGGWPPREVKEAPLDINVLGVSYAAERVASPDQRLERRSVDGDVALDGGVETILQPQRRLADVGREIDLLRDELGQGHAARHLHLAAVQLAAHLVDDEGVLAEGDAAAHLARRERESAKTPFAVLDSEVAEERRSPEGSADRRLHEAGSGRVLQLAKEALHQPAVHRGDEAQAERS